VGINVANNAITGTNPYSWTLTDPRGRMNPILRYHFCDGLWVDP